MKNINYINKIISLLLIFVIISSCNDFTNQVGKVINAEKSKYYHYGNQDKHAVFYYSNAFLGDTPRKMENVDKDTFEVISETWAKDKNSFYFKNLKVTNVDYQTFKVESKTLKKLDNTTSNYRENLLKDKNNVYRLGETYLLKDSIKLEIVENAEPESYELIGKQAANFWSKDKNQVFFNYKKFDGDQNSFELLSDYFAKDKDNLYFIEFNSSLKEKVNTNELKVLNPFYIRTNSNVYFFKDNELNKFALNDFKTIKVFDSNKLWIKADDKLYVYGELYTLDGLDYKNFESLNNYYFSDGKAIYYSEFNSLELNKVTNNVSSFSSIKNSPYAKDHKNVYYKDKIIVDADPKTFKYDDENEIVQDANGEFSFDLKQKNYVRKQK